MSYAPGYSLGSIPLVGSLGQPRTATYRAIYLLNPFVYAAVNYIARGVSRLPLHVYELGLFGGTDEVTKTRIRSDVPQTPGRPSAGVELDRILSNPGGRESRQAFYRSALTDKLIYGSALLEIERAAGRAMPTGLRRVAWRNVTKVVENVRGVQSYEIDESSRPYGALYGSPGDGDKRILLPVDVVHLGLGSDPEGGCPPSILESCQHTLALHEAVMRHLMAYLANSARASGAVEVPKLTAEVAKEIRREITELYTSPENAGKVLVTSGKWTSMSDSPDHAKLVELIKESRIEIAAAYQTPPPILGLLENAIRANVKELREQYGRETLGPHAEELEGDLLSQLIKPVPSWAFFFASFQLAAQLRPDLEARAIVYQRLMHIYSIDEIRELEDRQPFRIPGVTDVPWIASGGMPLTTAAEKGKAASRAGGGRGQIGESSELSLDAAVDLVSRLDELEKHLLTTNGNGHRTLDMSEV